MSPCGLISGPKQTDGTSTMAAKVGFHHPSCEPQNKKRAVEAFNAGEKIHHRKDSISSFHRKALSETRSSSISSFQGEKYFRKKSSGDITSAMITTNTSSSGGTGRCYWWYPRHPTHDEPPLSPAQAKRGARWEQRSTTKAGSS